MVGYLVVAARNRQDLHDYLRRQFSGDDRVEILLDRRRGERRRRIDPHEPERRRGDRRSGPGTDDRLHYYGLIIVRQLPDGQRRPVPWISRPSEEAVNLAGPRKPEETKATESRERVTTWISEGVRMSGLGSKLLREQGQVVARAETAERKCERLEEEVTRVRRENDHFRKQRAQMAEVLKTLAKELVQPLSSKYQ
ncbi:MAG TPA: hypothetical protein VLT62_22465 [Candidatus Methylomirabilis sp.]|nr:hypothetical protein [Candidatus Methylomirabilis sp.]